MHSREATAMCNGFSWCSHNDESKHTTYALQALRQLQPLLQSPQVGLAAKAALIYATGYAEDHDKEVAVTRLATELDVSTAAAVLLCTIRSASFWSHLDTHSAFKHSNN